MTESGYRWKVVPLSEGQLLDVCPSDIIAKGHFRKCNTYKAGGGYDQFPIIAAKHIGEEGHHSQFVVQLYGCNLDCPYCYVTRKGVWGDYVEYESTDLVSVFSVTGCSVFHLMGGAPALAMHHWPELISILQRDAREGWVFHSDLMLSEFRYDPKTLASISHPRGLYAVNIKGVTPDEYYSNTRRQMTPELTWANLRALEQAGVPYYITFTNIRPENIELFWGQFTQMLGSRAAATRLADAFSIDLIDYEALAHVDDLPWGSKAA